MAYAYFNTRLRAVAGEILPLERVLELSAAQGPDDLTAGLERRGFHFPAGIGFTPLQRLETGIRDRHADRTVRILSMARGAGRPAEMLIRGGFLRWDVHTVKTLIRGKVHRRPAGEIADWAIPGGFFDDTVIRESLRQPTPAHMAAFWLTLAPPMGGSLGRRVRGVLEGLSAEGTDSFDKAQDRLAAVETALDHAWAADLLGRIDPSGGEDRGAKRWVRLQVDRINLLTAFRISGERGAPSGNPESWFLSGGEMIPLSVFLGFLHDPDRGGGALAALPHPWREAIADSRARPLPLIPPLLDLELRWDGCLLREFSRKAVEDPLGIAPGFQTLQRIVRETTALRLIVSGIGAGIPAPVREEWIRGIYR